METKRTKEVWPIPFTPFQEDGSLDLDAVPALVEFYLEAGAAGLFALGASGEVKFLDDQERLSVAKAIAQAARGRCPVAASGNFGEDLMEQAEALMKMRDVGVDIPVLLLSSLPRSEPLAEQLLAVARSTEGPLGLYESFGAEHRVLSSQDSAVLADSGRFVFMKETSKDLALYTAKVKAAEDSPFKIYQANLERLPASLEAGGPGFCGVVANVWPAWVDRCCNDPDPRARREAHASLMQYQEILRTHHYPASGKYLVRLQGVPIKPAVRAPRGEAFSPKDRSALERFSEGLFG